MPTVPGPTESARMFTTEKAPLMNPKPRPDTETRKEVKLLKRDAQYYLDNISRYRHLENCIGKYQYLEKKKKNLIFFINLVIMHRIDSLNFLAHKIVNNTLVVFY